MEIHPDPCLILIGQDVHQYFCYHFPGSRWEVREVLQDLNRMPQCYFGCSVCFIYECQEFVD